MSDSLQLRLGHPLDTLRASLHNGPGWRVSLWVQGCSLLCTANCLNPHYLPAEGGFTYAIPEVLQAILAAARCSPERCEGVTVLGGEPTDQIEPLTALLEAAQAAGLSTMVYTGLTIEALRRAYAARAEALLRATDLLKDGPFVEGKYAPDLQWRGSANQRLHCLSPRYTPESLAAAFGEQGKGYSILLSPTGTISLSGLQNRAAAHHAEQKLSEVATPLERESS